MPEQQTLEQERQNAAEAAEELSPEIMESQAQQQTVALTPTAGMSREISDVHYRLEADQRMARLFVASGLFGDIKGRSEPQMIAQAYVKIALGRSMGFSEAESMQGIDIIQGRPAIAAQLRAARLQRAGYKWTIPQLDNEACHLVIYHGDTRLGEVVFGIEEAKAMGLASKDNWKKNTQDMLFARAITRAQRRFAPGVLGADILSSEEARELAPPEGVEKSEIRMPQRSGNGTLGTKGGLQLFEIAKDCGVSTYQLGIIFADFGIETAEDVPLDKREAVIAEIRKLGASVKQ